MRLYRKDGGFSVAFPFVQKTLVTQEDPEPIDLTTIFVGSPTIRWHFKDREGNKQHIDWTGIGNVTLGPEGVNNVAHFLIPDDTFFAAEKEFDTQFEVFNSGVLVLHSAEIITVNILEPVGVHSD